MSTRPDAAILHPETTWGLALAWYPEYTDHAEKDDFFAKMSFLERYGMKAFTITFEELEAMDEATKDRFFREVAAGGFTVSPHFSTKYLFDDSVDSQAYTETLIERIEAYAQPLNCRIVTTTLGPSHRYDRIRPFEEKVELFSKAFAPIARCCGELGAPLALENHADYYVSEIVDIIVATPGMYIFFDTANALHIGEKPVQAARDAAPYTLGTHFKDHRMVRGEGSPVHYLVTGCALGDGDAELESVYEILMRKCPNKERLVMLFELFKGKDDDALACFEKSVRYVRTLQDRYGI